MAQNLHGFGLSTEHEPKACGPVRVEHASATARSVLGVITPQGPRPGSGTHPDLLPERPERWNQLPEDELAPIPFCQRRARRIPVTGWAVARVTDAGGEKMLTGVRYIDSCPGGLGLESASPILPGSEIVLHYQGQSDPSRFGVVRWCRAQDGDEGVYRLGVECVTPVAAA